MITAEQLRQYISDDRYRQNRINVQSAYVKGTNPSILADAPKEDPDNRIPVPFARRAVNMVLGYMFKEGNIVYSGDGYDPALKETFDANDEGLLDLELASTALAHGTAYELHWTEGSKDQFAQIPAIQCIAIYDDSLKPKMTGFIRHWRGKDKVFHAHVYDNVMMQSFVSDTGAIYTLESEEDHGYGRVPVVRFCISSDGSNLFDHVTALIDFYDKIMSEDFANELAKFASSYLLMASQLSDETHEDGETEVDKIKRTKIFANLAGEKSIFDQIGFLTKDINGTFIDSAADRTERLIYEMMQIINPDSEGFVQQSSGESQKWRLIAFEFLCTTIFTYFSIGLQDRISLVKGIDANLSAGNNPANTDVTIKCNRNLPDDLLKIAQIFAALGGDKLSLETLLKLFPSTIIENVDEEIKRIESSVSDDPFATGDDVDATGVVATDGNVQSTALNGAQVASLQGIAQAVADETLPYATALELVQIAFPTIDKATAERMLKPADAFTPKPAPVTTGFGNAKPPAI